MTTTAAAIPTDNPATVAVAPEAIADPTPSQLVGRVHAKLCEVETSVAGVAHKVESFMERILARVEEIAARAAGPVGAAAAAIAAVAPPPISTIAAEIAAVCGCGHDVLHTKGGCTAPDCTCKTPPKK